MAMRFSIPRSFSRRAGLGKKLVKLKKSEAAFAQGDPADAIFYVQKGRLRVTVTSTNGKEATITLVGPGEFVGENCMVSAHPLHLATATAMTDCELLKIGKAEMVRVLHNEPKLSDMFVQFLLTRNARIQDDLVDQLFNSSEKRLARILLLLAQFGKESKPETVVPKVSQEILAEMIGTTRSRVSFFMNRFRKLGFIEYNGEIRDPQHPAEYLSAGVAVPDIAAESMAVDVEKPTAAVDAEKTTAEDTGRIDIAL